MTEKILINGKAASVISVFDRGLLYGDGLFETIRVVEGKPRLWQQHMQRLEQGCQKLGLPSPDRECLAKEVASLLEKAAQEEQAVIKIIWTRGQGPRGFAGSVKAQATRIVMLQAFPEYSSDYASAGVKTRICSTRLAKQPALAGLKHLNCLQQVLARNEWTDPDIAEGFMLDEQENVIEGCMSNVFMVYQGRLQTPDLSSCGVAGVVRHSIIQLVQDLDLPLDIKTIGKQQLIQSEEIFICNSLVGIWPVKQLQQRKLPVGSITRQIMEHLVY